MWGKMLWGVTDTRVKSSGNIIGNRYSTRFGTNHRISSAFEKIDLHAATEVYWFFQTQGTFEEKRTHDGGKSIAGAY